MRCPDVKVDGWSNILVCFMRGPYFRGPESVIRQGILYTVDACKKEPVSNTAGSPSYTVLLASFLAYTFTLLLIHLYSSYERMWGV